MARIVRLETKDTTYKVEILLKKILLSVCVLVFLELVAIAFPGLRPLMHTAALPISQSIGIAFVLDVYGAKTLASLLARNELPVLPEETPSTQETA